MAHTLGPLDITGLTTFGDCAIVKDGTVIGEAHRSESGGKWQDAKANAQLWAAAPELLKACKALHKELGHIMRKNPHLLNPVVPLVLTRASAAIDKATAE